jgi:hypothetical protein
MEAEARLRFVVVGIAVTVTEVAGLAEAVLFASPTYCAERMCAPSPLRMADKVALLEFPEAVVPRLGLPIIVVPSKKFTVPVGTAFDCVPATIAVSTLLDPACTGEGETVSAVVVDEENGDTVTVTLPNGYAA